MRHAMKANALTLAVLLGFTLGGCSSHHQAAAATDTAEAAGTAAELAGCDLRSRTQDILDAQAGNAEAATKISTTISAHTNHPYAPTRMMGLSNCTGCHMSSAGGHTFKAISPDNTIKYADAQYGTGGMANSCATGCHQTRVDIFNVGVKTTTSYAAPWDVTLAKFLQKYYGDGGIWWNTNPTK